MNDFKEPEEAGASIGNATVEEVSPLTDEPVIERPHTTRSGGSSTPVNEWAPPPFTGEPGDRIDENANDHSESNDKHEFSNDKLDDAPPSQKMEGAKYMSSAIVEALDTGVQELGNYLLKISPEKLDKLANAGEINPNIEIYYAGERVSGYEGIGMFNKEVHNALALTEEYKELTKEILAEELAKRNIGLTKFQTWLYIATPLQLKKLAQVGISIKNTGNALIDAFRDATASPYYPPPPSPPMATAAPVNTPPTDTGDQHMPENSSGHVADQPAAPEQFAYDPAAVRTHNVASAVDDIQMGRGQGGIIPPTVTPMISKKSRRKYKPRKNKVKFKTNA